MKTDFSIRGGQLVLPGSVQSGLCLNVRAGKIASLTPQPDRDLPVIDAQGQYVMPGFIDIHVHGGGGADFMDGTAEAIRTAAQAHCAHGTTSIVPTTMTCPDEELREFIRLFLTVKREGTGSAELLGLHLEGPFFSSASRGAQPVGDIRVPEEAFLREILALAEGEIIRWDAAPELGNMEMFARVMREHGVLCAVAHTDAVADETEAAFSWGFSHVTHFYNAITTYRKLSDTRNYAGVVEATYLHDEVTLELIGDGRHVPKQSLLLALKLKSPDGIALITDAMRAAGQDVMTSVLGKLDSGVSVVIYDGVAQMPDKLHYAGSIATMDRVLRTVHAQYGVPLCDTVRMMTLTPARLCGVQARKGSLEAGKDADILLVSPELNVERVFVGGAEHEADRAI